MSSDGHNHGVRRLLTQVTIGTLLFIGALHAGAEIPRPNIPGSSLDRSPSTRPQRYPTIVDLRLEKPVRMPVRSVSAVVEMQAANPESVCIDSLVVKVDNQVVYSNPQIVVKGNTAHRFTFQLPTGTRRFLSIQAEIIFSENGNRYNSAIRREYSIQETESGVIELLYKNERPNVHGWAAYQAKELLDNPALETELETYFSGGADPTEYHNCPDSYSNLPDTWDDDAETGSSVLEGTWEEDIDWYGWARPSLYHFWNPDTSYDDGLLGFSSALTKAQYWWNAAVTNYPSPGTRAYAYYCLGRVIHLLGDMGVPDHVFKDAHLGRGFIDVLEPDSVDISNYEEYTALSFKSYTGDGSPQRVSSLPLALPPGYLPAEYNSNLGALFYNMAQIARRYDSSDYLADCTPEVAGVPCNPGSSRVEFTGCLKLNTYPLHPTQSVAVSWNHGGQTTLLVEGTDYEISRGAGYVYLKIAYGTLDSFDVWHGNCSGNNGANDHIFLVQGEGNANIVSDDAVHVQAQTLFRTNIRYIAGLYELFWSHFYREPVLQVPASASSGEAFWVSWTQGLVNSYDLQEATNPDFSGATTIPLATNGTNRIKTVSSPTTFYYRVRCMGDGNWSGWSNPAQTVVTPGPSGSITLFNLAASPSTIPSQGATTISGSARYSTGSAVPSGTVTLSVPGGNVYTAAVVDGAFSRLVAGPQTSGSVSIAISDGVLTGSSSVYITVTDTPTGNSYTLENDVIVSAWDDGATVFRTAKDSFRTDDAEVNGLTLVTNASLSTPIDHRLRFYYPNGNQYGGDITNRVCPASWNWCYRYDGYLIAGNSMEYNQGRYTLKFYTNDNNGQGWKYKATQYFTVGWDLTEHRMCKGVGSEPEYNPISPTNVFLSTDAQAVTWANFDFVAQPMDIRWDFIEPSGVTYSSFYYSSEDPGTGNWFPWYRTWGWIDIQGNQAAQKCGEWSVNVSVRNPGNGQYEQRYTDAFRIMESPATAPQVSAWHSPEHPAGCQGLSLSFSASDNTLLKKVVLYWNDGTLKNETVDGIFQSSYSGTKELGSYVGSTDIEYYAVAWDTSGNVAESTHQHVRVNDIGVPGAPVFSAIGCSQTTLSWGSVPGAAAYDVWRLEGECGGPAVCVQSDLPGTTYVDASLQQNTTYSYFVVAKNGTCHSSNGYCGSLRTRGAPGSVPAPTTPVIAATSLTVSWTAVADAVSYDVWRQTGSSCVSATKITGSPVTALSLEDSGLTCGTQYAYFVTANNACGISPNGACGTAITAGCCTPPAPPNLTSTTGTCTGVNLAWTAGTGTTSAYNIYRTTGACGGTYTKIAGPITGLSYPDTTAAVGTTYAYVVRGACDAGGVTESGNSNCLSATRLAMPAAPTAPSFSGVGSTGLTVGWSAVSGATSYDVWRAVGATCAGAMKVTASPVSATSYGDAGLSPGTYYSYYIVANNACGASPNGACGTVQTGSGASCLTFSAGAAPAGGGGASVITPPNCFGGAAMAGGEVGAGSTARGLPAGWTVPEEQGRQVAYGLSFAQRLEAQARLERVYHSRRIWPADNPGAKPSFEDVCSLEALKAKVQTYLEGAIGLERRRGVPLSDAELDAELARMEKNSKDLGALRLLFAALDEDPLYLRECLARPSLAEREALGEALEAMVGPAPAGAPDTWAAMSAGASCPAARLGHTAVWTGNEMVVWGGRNTGCLNTGGRYYPATDSWSATSLGTNCPLARAYHSAVWTGTEMVVWGGTPDPATTSRFNTGGRYNPASDSWQETSIGAGCPSGVMLHTAIWTGTELIVWGGIGSSAYSNAGGRYSPSGNTWSATPTGTNCPSGRNQHTAIWTGSDMIIWGGWSGSSRLGDGAKFTPATNSWTPTSLVSNPQARNSHRAVWTGTEMIVWGGEAESGVLNSGAKYRPATDSWTGTSTGTNCPTARTSFRSVWTGSVMIVWGGEGSGFYYTNTGGAYDPASDTWAATSTGTNCAAARRDHSAVWTGSEMLVWGGYSDSYLISGAKYTPAAGGASSGYLSGTAIALVAQPAVGYAFAGWTGTGGTFANASQASTTFTIAGNGTATAHFSPAACTAPGAPTLTSATGTCTGVNLAWTAGTGTTSSYNVYRSSNAACPVGTLTKLNASPIPAGTLAYSDTTAAVGAAYTYVVRGACDAGGATESANSNCLPGARSAPGTPVISGDAAGCGSVTLSTGPYSTYQWYRNGVIIDGATSQTHGAMASGSYTVTVTNAAGCQGTSSAKVVAVEARPAPHVRKTGPTLWGTNGTVYSAVENNGVLYLGGTFTRVGQGTGSLGVFSAGSSTRLPTWPTVAGAIFDMVADGSGGWYIGGNFTRVDGYAIRGLARVRSDGTVDTTFAPNPDTVMDLELRGTTLYVAGTLNSMWGQSRSGLAAVEVSTGTLAALNPAVDDLVHAMAFATDTVYLGGEFSTVNGQARRALAALSLSSGALLGWNPGLNYTPSPGLEYIDALAVSGGTVFAGGLFDSAGGASRQNLAALDGTSGTATSWQADTDGDVWALAVSGSTLYAGGFFWNIGGTSRSCIAALDVSGGAVSAWNPNIGGEIVESLRLAGSTIYLAGVFDTVGGVARANVAEVDLATGAPTAWNPDPGGYSMSVEPSGGRVAVGGQFSFFGGTPRSNLAAIDLGTGAPTGWNPGANSTVYSLGLANGTLYLGGTFSSCGGEARNFLAAVDASTGALSAWNPGANNLVRTLAVSGSVVYVGGQFSSVGGQTRSRLAAIDLTTGAPTAWNPAANGYVAALATSGSTVYAGGSFTTVGGQPRNRIAALDATTGLATSWNPNANSSVSALCASGTTVYAGGAFTTIGGQSRSRVAALNGTTGLADAWNPGADGTVLTIARANSTVYVGGAFGVLGGVSLGSVGALDADTGVAHDWAMGLPAGFTWVYVLLPSVNTVHAAGSISTALGEPVGGVTALPASPLAGCSATLTAGSYSNYQWNKNGAPIAGATAQTYTVSGSGSYTVTVTSANGCPATSPSRVLLAGSAPVPTVVGNSSGCGSVSLTTASFSSYQWIKDGGDILGATAQSYMATASGTYAVRVTDATGCQGTSAAKAVTINPLPTPTVTGAASGCPAGVTLGTQAYSAYQWIKDGGDISGATEATYTATVSGSYAVRVTDAAGCQGTSPGKAVTINPPPSPTVTRSAGDCGAVALGTQSFGAYQWYRDGAPIAGSVGRYITATTSGTYTVLVTDGNGCQALSPGMAVSIAALPAPLVDGPSSGCALPGATLATGSFSSYQWLLSPSGLTGSLRVVATCSGGGGNTYYYDLLVSPTYVLQAGDVLEYDEYIDPASPQARSGIDLISGTWALRGASAVDQNGFLAHPSTELSRWAKGAWYRRSIPIPASGVGKPLSGAGNGVFLAFEGDLAGTYTTHLNHVRITNGGTTMLPIYEGLGGFTFPADPTPVLGVGYTIASEGYSQGEPPAGALKLAGTVSVAGNSYYYDTLGPRDYTLGSGDYLEYDIFIDPSSPQSMSGVDLAASGWVLRDQGAVDQNGLLAHPTTDLSLRARGKWYHRSIAIPASGVGKSLAGTGNGVLVALEGNSAGSYASYFTNIRITRGGLTRLLVYDGAGFSFPSSTPLNLGYSGTGRSVSNGGAPLPGGTGPTWAAVEPGLYSVAVTSAGGCAGMSAAKAVTIEALPTPTVTGPSAGCSTGLALATQAYSSYQWVLGAAGGTNALKLTGTMAARTAAEPPATDPAMAPSGTGYYYDVIAAPNYTIQSGDVLEYDLYIDPASPEWKSAVELVGANGGTNWTLRGSGAVDQNGLSAHPSTNLAAYARGKWYHRTVAIPASGVGVSLSGTGRGVFLALEGDSNGSYTTYVTGVKITRSSVTVLSIYEGGASFTFPADAGYTFWLGYGGVQDAVSPGGADIPGATGQTYSATATGAYSVRVTGSNGCTGTSAPKAVTVSAAPAPVVTGNGSGCGATTLSTGAFSSYQWVAGTAAGANALKLTATVAARAREAVSPSIPPGMAPSGTSYYYDVIAKPSYTLLSEDVLEYDIFISASSPAWESAVDLVASGWALRDSGAVDQNGLSAHPAVSLAARAKGRWYHRSIAIPPSGVGKSLAGVGCGVFLALEGDAVGAYATYVTGVKITRSGVTVLSVYEGGESFTFPDDAGYTFELGYSGAQEAVSQEGAEILGATAQSYTATASGIYKVRVVAANGCPGTSAPATVTLDAPPASPADTLRLTKPSGTVSFAWGSCAGAQSYNVRVNTTPGASPGAFSLLGTTAATSYTDTLSLPSGSVYWYTVEAVSGSCVTP